MRAGSLSERLVIQTAGTPSSDGQGGTTATPATLATIWAEPMPQSATEQLQAESVGSHALYRFKARARADVNAGMTALWTPRGTAGIAQMRPQIVGTQPLPDRGTMQINCAVVQ